jgi:peptidoglycan/xylan/chitin deacetylase (PgdA/CDA1 family)
MLKLFKIPLIIQWLFPSLFWNKISDEKCIYLTFDDGPLESLTPFILNELKKYNAKATFFYLGKQVEKYPSLVEICKKENHQIGHHTYSHIDGWKTKNKDYYKDIEKGNKHLKSVFFRPPYGRIKPSQIRHLKKHYKIIMWDILSWDFDINTSAKECYNNVIKHSRNGSIIVFHENEKSKQNVKKVLPKLLKHFDSLGYKFKAL